MTDDPTPADLRRIAASLRADAARVQAHAGKLLKEADLLDAAAESRERAESIVLGQAAIGAVHEEIATKFRETWLYKKDMQTEKHNEPGRGRRPENAEHPIFDALSSKGLSLRSWCTAHRNPELKLASVSHWIRGRYPIPDVIAEAFRKELGVPLSAWSEARARFDRETRAKKKR